MEQRMRNKIAISLIVIAVGLGVSAPSVLATPASGVTSPLVVSALLDELNIHSHATPANSWGADLQTRGQTDLYVVDNKFNPGGTTGWHSHPGPSLILVTAGSVTNYSSDAPNCEGVTYSKGQTFVDAGGQDVHMVRNNTSSAAETIAVQYIPHGDQRKIDKPEPDICAASSI
jgi:quercetin dioxygenase-like cupin family protein